MFEVLCKDIIHPLRVSKYEKIQDNYSFYHLYDVRQAM